MNKIKLGLLTFAVLGMFLNVFAQVDTGFDDRGFDDGFAPPFDEFEDDFSDDFDRSGPNKGPSNYGGGFIPAYIPDHISPEDIISDKLGKMVFDRFTYEDLEGMCPDVEQIVDKVYSYVSENADFTGMCNELDSEIEYCKDNLKFCDEIGEDPEPQNKDSYKFSCPFQGEEFFNQCLERSTQYMEEEKQFKLEDLQYRCDFEWENTAYRCAEEKRFQEEETERYEKERQYEEERRRLEEEKYRQEEERRRYEEEQKYQDNTRHYTDCPEIQPDPEFERECNEKGGFFKEDFDGQCVRGFHCVEDETKYQDEEFNCPEVYLDSDMENSCQSDGGYIETEYDGSCVVGYFCKHSEEFFCPQIYVDDSVKRKCNEYGGYIQEKIDEKGCLIDYFCEGANYNEPTSEETNPAHQTNDDITTQDNPDETTNSDGTTAQAQDGFFDFFMTGFQSLFGENGEVHKDEFYKPKPPRYIGSRPDYGSPGDFCDQDFFVTQCLDRGKKDLERGFDTSHAKRQCEFETGRMKRESERICDEMDRGKEECKERTLRQCEFLEKQKDKCQDFTTEERIKDIIRKEASHMCKVIDFRQAGDRHSRAIGIVDKLQGTVDDLPEQFQPLLRVGSNNIIEAEQGKDEVFQSDSKKDVIYQLSKMLGAQQQREIEEAEKLKKQAQKLNETIESLQTIIDQVDDLELQAVLKAQLEAIKTEQEELANHAKEKESGAAGILGFITGLFG